MACVSACAAMLSHTLMASLLGIIFAGVLAASCAAKRRPSRGVLIVFFASFVLVAGFYGLYLRPLTSGWNASEAWGYGVVRSLMASVNMIGWPVTVLATVGVLLQIHERTAQGWYWVACAAGWVAATVAFPLAFTYHPAYVFPLALSGVVAAGSAVGVVFDDLRKRSSWIAAVWVALACMANLPSLASHYVDGSRPDMRSAAGYVRADWKAGDRVTGYSIGLFLHYAPDCKPAVPLSGTQTVAELRDLAGGSGRLWVVLQSSRSGLPDDVSRWLRTHCSHAYRVRRTRYDYADYAVDVFLCDPSHGRPPVPDPGSLASGAVANRWKPDR